jgi:predicted nucleic acid-binding protein
VTDKVVDASAVVALLFTLGRIDVAEAIALAERTKLSLYDASYLWLARALDAEPVTLDAELVRADKALRRVSE